MFQIKVSELEWDIYIMNVSFDEQFLRRLVKVLSLENVSWSFVWAIIMIFLLLN
jgi:hypothetical protein